MAIELGWGNIDINLKQRFDEITNLVSVCRQYVQHETDLFQNILDARTNYQKQTQIKEKINISKAFETNLSGLLALVENYPDLKSNEQFMYIQKRLTELENSLSGRREFVNDAINTYNLSISEFPDFILARMINYQALPYFKVEESDKKMPSLEILKLRN